MYKIYYIKLKIIISNIKNQHATGLFLNLLRSLYITLMKNSLYLVLGKGDIPMCLINRKMREMKTVQA